MDDPRDGAIGVDSVNRLDDAASVVKHLFAHARSIAWVGEINAATGIDGQVFGLVVALALIAIGQHGNLAVRFGARYAGMRIRTPVAGRADRTADHWCPSPCGKSVTCRCDRAN